METFPRRRELAAFLAVIGFVYLTIHRDLRHWNNGNIWSRAALMFAVVEQHQLTIDAYANHTEDWARYEGHYYSNKPPGPALLAAPFYFVQYQIEKALDIAADDMAARTFAVYLANAVTAVIPTLAALALLWLTLLRRFQLSPLAAYAVCTVWAVGSLGLVYGVIFFGHQTAAAFFAIGMCLSLLELEGPRRARRLFWAGVATGVAVASDYASVTVVFVWTLWVAWRAWPWRVNRRLLGAWVLGGLGPALLLGAYNTACFGSPLRTAYNLELINPHWAALNTLTDPDLGRLADVTVRPWRGLFYCTPIYALALVGLDQLRRRSAPELWAAAFACLAFFAYLTCLPASFGGFCVGPRYVTSLLPLATLLLVPAVQLVPRLFAALTAGSTALMLVAALTDPLPHEALRDPYRERLIPLLLANSPDGGQVNALGEVLGLSLTGSLLAYLALLGSTWVWLWRRNASRAEAK